MPLPRQELLAEAQRRGLIDYTPDDTPHFTDTVQAEPFASSALPADIPAIDSGATFSRSELLAEAKRRGLLGEGAVDPALTPTPIERSPIPVDRIGQINVDVGAERPDFLSTLFSNAYEKRPRAATALGTEEAPLSTAVTPRFQRTGFAPVDFAEVAIEGTLGFPAQILEDPIGAIGSMAAIPSEFVRSGIEAYWPGQTPEEQAEKKTEFSEHIAGVGAMGLFGGLAKYGRGTNAISEFRAGRFRKQAEAARVEGADFAMEAGLGQNPATLDALTRQAKTFTRPPDQPAPFQPAPFQPSPVESARGLLRRNRGPFGEPVPTGPRLPVSDIIPSPGEIPTYRPPFGKPRPISGEVIPPLGKLGPRQVGPEAFDPTRPGRQAPEPSQGHPTRQKIVEQAQGEGSRLLNSIKAQLRQMEGKADPASMSQRAELNRMADEVRGTIGSVQQAPKIGRPPKPERSTDLGSILKKNETARYQDQAPPETGVPQVDITPKAPKPVKTEPVAPKAGTGKPVKAKQGEKHFLFLERDGKRVPVAGPFASEAALKAELPKLKEALSKRDPYTDFDTRVLGKTSDQATIDAYTKRIGERFPEGKPVETPVKPSEPRPATATDVGKKAVETPKEAIAEIIEGKQESKIGTKEFKKRMIAEIDKLQIEHPLPKGVRSISEFVTNKEWKLFTPRLAKETVIKIPGDGEFRLKEGADLRELHTRIRKLKEKVPSLAQLTPKRTQAGAPKTPGLKEGLAEGTVTFTPKEGGATTFGFAGTNPEIFRSIGATGQRLIKKVQEIKKARGKTPEPPPPRVVYRKEPKLVAAKSAPADLSGIKFENAPASATSTKGVGKNAGTNYKTFWKDIIGRDGAERQYQIRVSDKGKVTVVKKGPDSKAQVIRDAKNSQVVKNMHVLPGRLVTQAPINLSWENTIRTMDRLGGPAKELFYRPAQKAMHNAVRKDRKVRRVFHKLVKDNARSNSSQRIYDYATSVQKGGKELLAEMGVTKIPKLTPGEVKIYNHMRGELEARYVQVNRARVSSGLDSFNKVDNYFTFFRNLDAMEKAGYSIHTVPVKALTDKFVKRSDTPFGFAKNRGIDGEIILTRDAFGVFEKYNESAFYHQEMTPVVSKVRRLLEMDHGDGWRLMERNPEAYDALSQWINFVAGETKTIIPKVAMRKIKKLQRNLTFAVLGANVRSIMIQPVALVNTAALIGPKYTAIGVYAILDPVKRTFIIKKSNVILGRQFEVAIVEALDSMTGKVGSVKGKIGRASMKGLQIWDMETAKATWYGSYKRGLEKYKMTDRQAVNYADDIVTKTQASASKIDIAPIQRTAEGGAVTHLQTFVINEWGMLRRDILGGVDARTMTKTEVAKRLSGYIAGATLVNILYEDIMGLQSPFPTPINAYREEMERSGDMVSASRAVGLELISQVPIVGGALQYGSSPFGPTVNLIENVTKKVSGSYGYTKPWWQLAGEATGVPGTSQIAKEVKGKPGSLRGLLTTRISRSDGKKDRGKWRARILDLRSKGKPKEAAEIMKEWNNNFPEYAITIGEDGGDARKDVGVNAVRAYLKRQAKKKAK